jgi:hypothetical protein
VLGIIGTAFTWAAPPPPRVEPDVELARQNIDLLVILQRKTKGNLTGDEERLLDQALFDLKSRDAEVTRGAS